MTIGIHVNIHLGLSIGEPKMNQTEAKLTWLNTIQVSEGDFHPNRPKSFGAKLIGSLLKVHKI